MQLVQDGPGQTGLCWGQLAASASSPAKCGAVKIPRQSVTTVMRAAMDQNIKSPSPMVGSWQGEGSKQLPHG